MTEHLILGEKTLSNVQPKPNLVPPEAVSSHPKQSPWGRPSPLQAGLCPGYRESGCPAPPDPAAGTGPPGTPRDPLRPQPRSGAPEPPGPAWPPGGARPPDTAPAAAPGADPRLGPARSPPRPAPLRVLARAHGAPGRVEKLREPRRGSRALAPPLPRAPGGGPGALGGSEGWPRGRLAAGEREEAKGALC